MVTTEAIVLAGGKGTRLSAVVNDRPKPMALINGRPFIEFLLDELIEQGITHVVLSVGFKAELVQEHLGDRYRILQLTYALEEKPLGTGGAILFAMQYIKGKSCFVLNGDTLFKVNFKAMEALFQLQNAHLVLALKPIKQADRYGTVELTEDQKISRFYEKQHQSSGLINGGIYLANIAYLNQLPLEDSFSFEKEVLEKRYKEDRFFGIIEDGYFIDIGIPKDYQRAQNEL